MGYKKNGTNMLINHVGVYVEVYSSTGECLLQFDASDYMTKKAYRSLLEKAKDGFCKDADFFSKVAENISVVLKQS